MRRLRFFISGLLLWFAGALFCQQPGAWTLSGDYPHAHDPAIARDGNRFYVFATGRAPDGGQLPIRCSSNLTDWKFCGQVFDAIPDWIQKASPKTRDLWAPDISFFHGRYHLYYACSVFGRNTSGIALATNETLDAADPRYHWMDEGLVLESIESDDFNAIDPNVVLDAKGEPWMSFGSFWSGIKMHRIDPATGKLSAKDAKLYSLAARAKPENAAMPPPGRTTDWQAIEAPFIVRHGSFYYLFVSFDLCCRGAKSTYRIMVGRSRKSTGPYVDADGKPMISGAGTQLLSANQRWLGPGGESILQRPEGDLLVFHAYDATTGKPALQISDLTWEQGWPHAVLGMSGESK
jgi:arabinan endo-1,5-alpha-L-arabinosidase